MFRTVLFTLIAALASTSGIAAATSGAQDSVVDQSLFASDVKQHGHEIVFVDTNVADYDTLISNLRNGLEVIVLDAEQDSVSQITSILQQRNNLSAVHIITHGRDGEILFANGNLNAENLKTYSSQLDTIDVIRDWINSGALDN